MPLPPLADPEGNTHSLSVTNRTASYMGPALNLLSVPNVVAGATYQVTAYVLLAAPDAAGPTATLSLKTTDCAAPSGTYGNIASQPIGDTGVDENSGHIHFQQSARAAHEPYPLHPVEQRDRFLLCERRNHQSSWRLRRLTRASRTTPASAAHLKTAEQTAGVLARAAPA